jgi:site-specific DNA-methyltransferase (adenine-specific)
LAWKYAQEIVWEKHNGTNAFADRFRRVHELAVQWYKGSWEDVYKNPPTTNDATAKVVRRKFRPPQWREIDEATYVSHDGGPRLMRSVIPVRSCHGYALHPTQKPIGIIVPLIEYSCPRDGLVVDPFVGSGSTLIAAKELGVKAIGIEASEAYCELAAKRLEQGLLKFEE